MATAMVLVMTPALAFFYGGMVRAKNTLNTIMMSFASLGFVGIAWALIGYSIAFSEGSGWIGGLRYAFLNNVRLDAHGSIPHVLFFAYQGTTSRVRGHGGELEEVETYRGMTVKVELHDKVRLEIGVSDHFVEPTVRAILASGTAGKVGDGKIFVLPVDRVYRIRTGEQDQAAVTPVAGE